MRIRLARDEDCAAIARMHRQTIRNINSQDYSENIIQTWSKRSTAQRFRKNAGTCKRWVAVEDTKIVGFCDHDFNGEFGGLYVHKDYIGKGIGSRLLQTVETSLQKYGCDTITLQSTITAKDFYLKHGYTVVKKAVHSLGDIKMPIFIMSKKFHPSIHKKASTSSAAKNFNIKKRTI